jgi:hypothetical protein
MGRVFQPQQVGLGSENLSDSDVLCGGNCARCVGRGVAGRLGFAERMPSVDDTPWGVTMGDRLGWLGRGQARWIP